MREEPERRSIGRMRSALSPQNPSPRSLDFTIRSVISIVLPTMMMYHPELYFAMRSSDALIFSHSPLFSPLHLLFISIVSRIPAWGYDPL
jgi:hypothetical protein